MIAEQAKEQKKALTSAPNAPKSWLQLNAGSIPATPLQLNAGSQPSTPLQLHSGSQPSTPLLNYTATPVQTNQNMIGYEPTELQNKFTNMNVNHN